MSMRPRSGAPGGGPDNSGNWERLGVVFLLWSCGSLSPPVGEGAAFYSVWPGSQRLRGSPFSWRLEEAASLSSSRGLEEGPFFSPRESSNSSSGPRFFAVSNFVSFMSNPLLCPLTYCFIHPPLIPPTLGPPRRSSSDAAPGCRPALQVHYSGIPGPH